MPKFLTGNEIRQSFIDFFVSKGHTHVPSASLIPGGDSTLLFTNAGMVQFKDVFLGIDKRPYTRAVNAQKCMRVSGKHNDLDEVGRDDTHHTFFEMLGNWSFGDYYKKEAIAWSWELLTEVWGLDKGRLWATYFKDDLDQISEDREAADTWLAQPGFIAGHLLPYGRKDNFWEMAETGPCGVSSEIHYDFGPEACKKKDDPKHICHVNAGCGRWTELWNNVFIQYNRLSPNNLVPLPQTHVDTGMGFERVVSVIQGVKGNYATDLLSPLLDQVQQLSGQSDEERKANITPYRVIADHVRAAAFLIADGVNPGNIGRNYICRMIIRRAARFARKLNLYNPFMAKVAEIVINNYGDAYPELKRSQQIILDTITREEKRFAETLDAGFAVVQDHLDTLRANNLTTLDGPTAFNLYATLGFPLEITRDILREEGFEVDEEGFHSAMEQHRLASGAGKAIGEMGGKDVTIYQETLEKLVQSEKLSPEGVLYDPYASIEVQGSILAIFREGAAVESANPGDKVEILLPETCFYLESGGQVSDSGKIISYPVTIWTIEVEEVRRPAAGVIVHVGKVLEGTSKVGDEVLAIIDKQRRINTMRNHTATHLLHTMLHKVVGPQASQAGSLVAPDRLRFDFNNQAPLTKKQLLEIETGVNQMILENYPVSKRIKPLQQAMEEGATALFGEKYGSIVRTIAIGEGDHISYELCGGTHLEETGEVGLFLITYEGSIASGIRRIEAVTGQKAYEYAREQMNTLEKIAQSLSVPASEVPLKVESLLAELTETQKETSGLRERMAVEQFQSLLDNPSIYKDVTYLSAIIKNADSLALRRLTDLFREKYPSGVVALASILDGKPLIIAAVTNDLVQKGLHAGNLVREIARFVDGGGGGKPDLAQAGGKDPTKLPEAMEHVVSYIKTNLKEQ
jgi:alanyl-tRNA synthetase